MTRPKPRPSLRPPGHFRPMRRQHSTTTVCKKKHGKKPKLESVIHICSCSVDKQPPPVFATLIIQHGRAVGCLHWPTDTGSGLPNTVSHRKVNIASSDSKNRTCQLKHIYKTYYYINRAKVRLPWAHSYLWLWQTVSQCKPQLRQTRPTHTHDCSRGQQGHTPTDSMATEQPLLYHMGQLVAPHYIHCNYLSHTHNLFARYLHVATNLQYPTTNATFNCYSPVSVLHYTTSCKLNLCNQVETSIKNK